MQKIDIGGEIYNQVDKMINSHTYTDIYLNRSLSSTGIAKNCYLRPDIIGKRIDDVFDIVEVASESQAIGQQLNVLVSHVDFYKTIDVVDKVILIKWGYWYGC